MEESRVCPICETANPSDAIHCEVCGENLVPDDAGDIGDQLSGAGVVGFAVEDSEEVSDDIEFGGDAEDDIQFDASGGDDEDIQFDASGEVDASEADETTDGMPAFEDEIEGEEAPEFDDDAEADVTDEEMVTAAPADDTAAMDSFAEEDEAQFDDSGEQFEADEDAGHAVAPTEVGDGEFEEPVQDQHATEVGDGADAEFEEHDHAPELTEVGDDTDGGFDEEPVDEFDDDEFGDEPEDDGGFDDEFDEDEDEGEFAEDEGEFDDFDDDEFADEDDGEFDDDEFADEDEGEFDDDFADEDEGEFDDEFVDAEEDAGEEEEGEEPEYLYSPMDGTAYAKGSPEYEEGFGPNGEELVATPPDAAFDALEEEIGAEVSGASMDDDELAAAAAPSPTVSAEFQAAFQAKKKERPVMAPLPQPGAYADPAVLTVYQNREPVMRLAIDMDEVLIGRRDPVADAYPDLDLSELDPEAHISRKHAYIYRQNKNYTLYAVSNAGTQLNSDLLDLGDRRKLSDGDVIVLAGKIAMKFELPNA